jgi:glycosyltransferase involved in cell wall biosynthesis
MQKTRGPYKIIIAEDSTDNTKEIVLEYQKKYLTIKADFARLKCRNCRSK